MASSSTRIVLFGSLVLAACGGRFARDDAGTDAGAAELPPATAAAFGGAGYAIGIAAALTAPLVPQAESLRDGGGRLDGAARDARTRTDVEAGVSGMSVVEPPTCATYAWSGLSVVVTFAGCTLEATGESIDGSIGVAVEFFPSRFTLTFSSLAVGATTVDGMLVLNVGGNCGGADLGCTPCSDMDATCPEMRANQSTVTGNLSVTSGTTTVLAITDLNVATDATGIGVTGAFAIDGTSITATNLHWNLGDCLPTSGSAATAAATITFLATTPADGIVDVRIGALPPFPQMIFMACPTP